MNDQKTHGVYYTPESIVCYLVDRTIGPLLKRERNWAKEPLRVLDPACGDGAFLEGVLQYLLDTAGLKRTATARARRRLLMDSVFGIDVDATALASARRRIARVALRSARSAAIESLEESLQENLRWGDFLLDEDAANVDAALGPLARDWQAAFPRVFSRCRDLQIGCGLDGLQPKPESGSKATGWQSEVHPGGDTSGFDVIIGNPPYVNARVLSKTRSHPLRQYLLNRYECASGACDLYVLFLERAYQWLRQGGRCGMIVPNKIAVLDYAKRCRSLLLRQTSLLEVVDVAGLRLFPGASVYPYILIFEKRAAPAMHRVSLVTAEHVDGRLRPIKTSFADQRTLAASGRLAIQRSLAVESRVPTRPLGQCAEIHSGTTGFTAHELARRLREQEETANPEVFDFIVSGNVDRYRIRIGKVRYMSRTWVRPVLSRECSVLSARKRSLFRDAKIVVAGLSRRIEAAWDEGGMALGVQVFALAKLAEPWYVLGLLNSKLFSYLFQTRYQAKRLGGGYLSIHKGQLCELPVPVIDLSVGETARCARRIKHLARCLSDATAPTDEARRARFDEQLDRVVYRLYGLKEREIEDVESRIEG